MLGMLCKAYRTSKWVGFGCGFVWEIFFLFLFFCKCMRIWISLNYWIWLNNQILGAWQILTLKLSPSLRVKPTPNPYIVVESFKQSEDWFGGGKDELNISAGCSILRKAGHLTNYIHKKPNHTHIFVYINVKEAQISHHTKTAFLLVLSCWHMSFPALYDLENMPFSPPFHNAWPRPTINVVKYYNHDQFCAKSTWKPRNTNRHLTISCLNYLGS